MRDWGLIGAAAQAILAAVFTLSGVSKTVTFQAFGETLEHLGVQAEFARRAAFGVVAVESLTGLGLAVFPTSAWPRLVALLLGLGFAGAGVRALQANEKIACSCFGGLSQSALGWRQLQLLPVWLVLAGAAQWWSPSWDPALGLLGVGVFLLIVTIVRLARHVPGWRRLRTERLVIGDLRAEAELAARQ
ncbi:MauE/DoxX family redox-associated membrane protein [Fodinicola feengrottensis]|uniref:Methylamine utilisation protein MauE domain-containing protein n=1 Tax=Fodinicola feengrottensis TaxID=435914 RepID=A0ABN2H5T7_9ACTN|nr:MauE/DoxX family redox-associated membrane protein [Fodinicola feengrottensis]